MGRWYNETSNHIVAKKLRSLGYTEFEFGSSRYKNEYGGWWCESLTHGDLNGLFLGMTQKDVLFNLKNPDYIKKMIE